MKTSCFFVCLFLSTSLSAQPLRALIIDGQNNHEMWPKTTMMMKSYLEATGLFSVDIERTAYTWKGEAYLDTFALNPTNPPEAKDKPTPDPNFKPKFKKYDLVVTNFGWNAASWPEKTQKQFEKYIRKGGGLVVVHAADNSFPEWLAYNQMIGLGGWGDRTEKDGPYVYYNDMGELVRDTSPGKGGSHGPQREFVVKMRTMHPITQDLPSEWLHTKDELYDRLRGPAENMTVLATAHADADQGGSGRHEPVLMTIEYGKGRIFHTTLGHADYSMEGVGFMVTLQRGAEWAATGEVTQTEVPEDFPTKVAATKRAFKR